MRQLARLTRRYPVSTFLALAFAFTWALLPWAGWSMAISLVALCGPAVAALATVALLGRHAWRDLRERIAKWRVPARWYVLALLAPVPISALAAGLEWLAGARGPVHLMPISPLQAVVFVLVAGEEIGWRGFLLPRVLERAGAWPASAFVGIVWAAWHLPLFFMASMPHFGTSFPAFVVYTTALSVLLTAFAHKTGGSVVIATLFHGAVNTFGVMNAEASPYERSWGNAVAYALAAIVVIPSVVKLGRKPMRPAGTENT